MPHADTAQPRTALPLRLLGSLLGSAVVLLLPVVLVLSGVRLVMTETFLRIEYNRPGFPADRYGLSTEERLTYAPYAVRYLTNDESISYLGDLTFPDGSALFNERELSHMADVKTVTDSALQVYQWAALALGLSALVLRLTPALRPYLWAALLRAGAMTITVIVMVVVVMLAAWDNFFTQFHTLFFEGSSWLFANSDTLIRLFPEQFWFDAALTIGLITIGGSLVAIAGGWRQINRR